MNIEENIKPLKILMSKYKQIDEMNNFDHELALVIDYTELSAIETLLTAYEKEKETSHYIQSQLDIANAKLVEEKEKNKDLKEGYKIQEHNYQVAMEEIEQRWVDKIKAKIEEVSNGTYDAKIVLESLLEKE